MNVTLGIFIVLCIVTFNITNIDIKNGRIIIRNLNLEIEVDKIINYNVYYLPLLSGRGAQIYGDNFNLRFINIQYTESKNNTLSNIRLTHDDLGILIKQIENMQKDNKISGYLCPSNAFKYIATFISFAIVSVFCLYLTDKSFNLINVLFAIFAFLFYKVINISFNKLLYIDYHKDLNKYAITTMHRIT